MPESVLVLFFFLCAAVGIALRAGMVSVLLR